MLGLISGAEECDTHWKAELLAPSPPKGRITPGHLNQLTLYWSEKRAAITVIPFKMKRYPFHPLRKLANAGNPNRPELNPTIPVPSQSPLHAYINKIGVNDFAQFLLFRKRVYGDIVTPLDALYDKGRMVSDNAFNPWPYFIVYCSSTTDVVETIQFCNRWKLKICVRAGGHNTQGYSPMSETVVIDVSRIKGIFVDPEAMTSTVGAGVTWGDYNQELNSFGLHNPGGSCNNVGMAGYTMGGGYGYTSIRLGMACDSLIEIRLVTAAGEIVTANEVQNSELLWAHRGGTGGNFGVVVSMKYRLVKLKEVWPIQVDWDIDHAAQVLTYWQNNMTKTLEDLHLGILGFLAFKEETISTQQGSGKIYRPYFCIRGIYTGESKEDGEKALAPLLAIGKPSYPAGPLWERTVPYSEANEHLLDNVEGIIPETVKETKRCAYIEKALTVEDYQRMVDFFKTSPSPYNIVSMEPYGGQINRVRPSDTAFVHRDAFFDIFTDSFWNLDSEKPRAFEWLNDYYTSPATKDLWSTHYYQNYVYDQYENWQQGYFGDNYQRLREIKTQWDRTNVFSFPQSIEVLPQQ